MLNCDDAVACAISLTRLHTENLASLRSLVQRTLPARSRTNFTRMETSSVVDGLTLEDNRSMPFVPWDFNDERLTPDMRFNEGHVVSIVTYSILMVISSIGNITVLVLLLTRRDSARSRINNMLIHLAIADLLVTFLMMPVEIGWASTVTWRAGDAMCRISSFFRMFGLYLSSFILICISLDRYYAVLRPLQMLDIDRRGKHMLTAAWICSACCSAPQIVVFHLEKHPRITWYEQCVTFNTFPSFTHEVSYSLFGMITMYFLPLSIIIFSYCSIIIEMYKRSRVSANDGLRRSSVGFLGRARTRTLKMTAIIVTAFIICWTPYYIMSIWYWLDKVSAKKVDIRIQKALFLFACTNSCVNPVVYGAFNIRKCNKVTRKWDIHNLK
ncbi:adipokinetic hormone/corazonin-related peptide receptor variant I isoform X2 [Phymastichus coffea]|uniref:adipokinetic hormone/corazonin-related peptide receptor variant I isoform X2 n=1 Tax=Phymastichus coffea TaxID=108790 RepID=UPI00273C8F34|nr:adipokinetic hormone/corazonin-related peptide receptor variant I isoform X2 [Phymastichus coffea]